MLGQQVVQAVPVVPADIHWMPVLEAPVELVVPEDQQQEQPVVLQDLRRLEQAGEMQREAKAASAASSNSASHRPSRSSSMFPREIRPPEGCPTYPGFCTS